MVNGSNGSSNGAGYQVVQSPGTSFSITCTPSVNVTGTGYPHYGSANVAVYFTAGTTPVRLVLSGGFQGATEYEYLIGQECTATVDVGGYTPTNIQWSVSGGQPFAFYSGLRITNQYIALDLSTQHSSSLTYYYKVPAAPSTVSCTFNVVLGTGPNAQTWTITAIKTTAVLSPTFSFDWTLGFVGLDSPPTTATELIFGGISDPIWGNVGIDWTGTVTTPSQFGTGGNWCIAQLVTPYRVLYQGNLSSAWGMNGTRCLDTRFPAFPAEPPFFKDDGTKGQAGDGANQDLVAKPDVLTRFVVSDSFETYFMYTPPGEASCPVPLHKMTWFWTGDARRTLPNPWYLYSGDDGASDGSDFPAFPTWSHNVMDNQWGPFQ